MGIGLIWQNRVTIALQDLGIKVVPLTHDKYDLLLCDDSVVINLIPVRNDFEADELLTLQDFWKSKNISLTQLWEDVWHTRAEQVVSRIVSILNRNKRLHGRKAAINTISQNEADIFLVANHIQGSAKAKYRFALEIDGATVAVACFSGARMMKRISEDYKSVELIRFATLKGVTVTGGFTKLLKHFIRLMQPNNIMSYADRDWSLGNAYEQAGFKLVGITPPTQIWLRDEDQIRVFPHRLPIALRQQLNSDVESKNQCLSIAGYNPVFNTGNLKYILYL